MYSSPPWGSDYLLPCPSCRVSQVPLAVLWIHAANTPDGPTPRSCCLMMPVAGFPIEWEGRRPPIRLTSPNRVRSRCGLHPVSVIRP